MKSKDVLLQKIMKMFADAATLKNTAQQLGERYSKKYSPFAVGDKVVVKVKEGAKQYGVVGLLHFDHHSELEGLVSLSVYPYTKNWERRELRRNSVLVNRRSEIIEHIKP